MTALLLPDEAARLVPGEQLVIARPGDGRRPDWWDESSAEFVAPQVWVALTGPCPTCKGSGITADYEGSALDCAHCRDGRRIEPLYTECQTCLGNPMKYLDLGYCPKCGPPRGLVLAGRGSIEVVPVVYMGRFDSGERPCVMVENANTNTARLVGVVGGPTFILDPKPVPGRDWGIVIDCVEAVS